MKSMQFSFPLALILVAGQLHADVGQWSGSGPFATGAGNRVVHALAIAPGGQTVYAGTGSGTVFSYVHANSIPLAFVFVDQVNVALAGEMTSNAITVSGINSAAAISVAGGEYRINGGAWTNVAGTVNSGDTVSVRHTSSAGYSTTVNTVLSIGGVSDTFSTTTLAPATAVNAACGSVAATSVKPMAGLCAGGSLSAAGVVRGTSAWSWACDGASGGTNTAPNACSASFDATATGSGPVSIDVDAGWVVAPIGPGANQTGGCIATSGHAKSPPSLPPGVSFPHGLCDVVLTGGAAGSTATLSLRFPSALPAGAVWWKYGRTAANPAPHWYAYPGAAFAGNTVTLSLTDGGSGDDDLAANGTIVDPGGPGVVGVAEIPTLSEWGALLLSGLMLLSGLGRMRPRRRPASADF